MQRRGGVHNGRGLAGGRGDAEYSLGAVALFDIDREALDFLVEGGEWNAEHFSGLGLGVVDGFEDLDDALALESGDDFVEGGIGGEVAGRVRPDFDAAGVEERVGEDGDGDDGSV